MNALAKQLVRHPEFVAQALDKYLQEHDITEPELMIALGLDEERYNALALCKRPRPERFRQDLHAIASYTGADIDWLETILKPSYRR